MCRDEWHGSTRARSMAHRSNARTPQPAPRRVYNINPPQPPPRIPRPSFPFPRHRRRPQKCRPLPAPSPAPPPKACAKLPLFLLGLPSLQVLRILFSVCHASCPIIHTFSREYIVPDDGRCVHDPLAECAARSRVFQKALRSFSGFPLIHSHSERRD